MINAIRGWFGRAFDALRVLLRQEDGFARYGYPDLKIEVDNSSGTPVDLSTYILSVGGQSKEKVLEEITAAGDADERWASVGLNRHGEITFGGPYDDIVTTGPVAILNSVGDTRTVKFTYGGTKTFEVEAIIKSFSVGMSQGELDTFEVVMRPTGASTEA